MPFETLVAILRQLDEDRLRALRAVIDEALAGRTEAAPPDGITGSAPDSTASGAADPG